MKKRRFESLRTCDEIEEYFRRVLTRTNVKQNEKFLYRYTRIDRLIEMLQSNNMILGSSSKMNDPFENALLIEHGMENKMFYKCFSGSPESLAMYRLYGMDADTVLYRISYFDLIRILNENSVDDYKSDYKSICNFNVMRDYNATKKKVEGELFCTAIGYVDPEQKSIKTGTRINKNIKTPFMKPKLAARIKFDCWEYEDEVRICGLLNKGLNYNECLCIKLPADFSTMINITLCPGFDIKRNNEYLFELAKRGINYNMSVYEPFYSRLLVNDKTCERISFETKRIEGDRYNLIIKNE